jgi:hypothetical protein
MVHNSLEAVVEDCHIEVDEEADALVRGDLPPENSTSHNLRSSRY